jgi:hypothetical protein
MKKLFGLIAAGVFVASIAAPASAGKAKPDKTTLYLHGTEQIGETESFSAVADTLLPMDAKKPAGTDIKSKMITNYGVGPNTQCAGNNLFPVWSGKVTGHIKGDIKFTFNTVGTPGQVEVRVWPDVYSSMCDSENPAATASDYPDPAGAVTVDLPAGPGTTEAVIKGVDFDAIGSLVVQISPIVAVDIPSPGGSVLAPFHSRILYDTADYASALEFTCVPVKGSKSCAL